MISRAACYCILGVVATCLAFQIEAANKPSASPPDEVQELLQSETQAANRSVDRRSALRPLAESNAANWQAGYVQRDKQWLRFEETTADAADVGRLNDYKEHRDAYLQRPNGHSQLAAWCQRNNLPEQERVHLLHALFGQDPKLDRDAAFRKLGCQKIDGVWVSLLERQEAVAAGAEIERSHKLWDSKLQGLVRLLEGSAKQRSAAEKQLAETTQASAVPSVVDTFCLTNQSSAEVGLKTLGQIPHYQASRAIAGQAVFSPWLPVRMQAAKLLKTRKLEEFAPDLLLLLSLPTRTTLQITSQARNSVVRPGQRITGINWDYIWVDESSNVIRIGIRRLFPVSIPVIPSAENNSNARNRFLLVATSELADQTDLLNYSAAKGDQLREELNERVGSVLSKTTGQTPSSDAKFWWDWWADFSNADSTLPKSVVIVDERPYQPDSSSFAIDRPRHSSCLVAGTPVWTERGLVPIEQIAHGDRVLAKDIASGELCYKPVLQSTVRNPTPVQQFCVGDDRIVASPGHHFWVSGDGWTKVRNFTPEQPLHTVTGMQRISSTQDDGQVEKVYNLVVADFHTYFVGKTMILSHDVTTPRLTNVKVPGLAAE